MNKSSLISIADAVIPAPNGVIKVVKTDFDTIDIIKLILFADKANNEQAAREMSQIAPYLQGRSDLDTLKNIWSFVRFNIKYVADPVIHEDVKLPSEVWHSGFADCKSKSIMVAALIKAFPQFGFRYRFASYDLPEEYTHVYVIVDTQFGPVIIDSVHSKFNDEVKYRYKKDYMARELRFIHGPGKVAAVSTGAKKPTLTEAFADAPKKIFTPAIIPVSSMTQGELLLDLLDQKYQILSAYYGDLNGNFSKARNLIRDVKKNKLENANLNVSLPDEFNFLLNNISRAKNKHINELKMLASLSNPSSAISGWQEEAADCVKKFNPERATWTWKNDPFNKRYVNIDYTQEIGGHNYKIQSDEFRACYDNVRKRSFATLHFFNSDNWVKGSHHILYKFLAAQDANNYGGTTSAKALNHKLAVGSLSNLSGFDEDVVAQYLENALLQNSGRIGLADITPGGSINILKEYAKSNQAKVGEPITAAVALIGAIVSALGGIAALLNSLDSSQKSNLQSNLAGFGTKGWGPEEIDFQLDGLNSSANNGLLIGGILAASGIALLLTDKKN